jgi:cytochrome c oxidase subunit IV
MLRSSNNECLSCFYRRTFSVKTAKAHAIGSAHQAKRLGVYLLLSWGVPLVLVVTCAVLDWLDLVAIGYRNKDACWMGNKTALLVVFAAPVGSVLVYNVLAFSQTIYAIDRFKPFLLSCL